MRKKEPTPLHQVHAAGEEKNRGGKKSPSGYESQYEQEKRLQKAKRGLSRRERWK